MIADLARTAREHFTVRYGLLLVAILAIIYGVTREVETVVSMVLGLIVVETIQILGETPSVDDRWVGVGVGGVITIGSLAWLGYELATAVDPGGPVWFPALTALIGVWFLFDARRDFVEGRKSRYRPDDDMTASEMMLVMSHAHLVADELKQGPKTVGELADACDLTESRVQEVLDVVTDDGMVYSIDGGSSEDPERYALNESKTGSVAFVRSNGKRILRRLGRPFRRW